jgi:hypothetical protein
VGLPAATLDNVTLTEAYRRVVAAAHLAASMNGDLSVEMCKMLLDNHRVLEVARDAFKAASFGIAVTPETAAEATGFFKSNRSIDAAYLMVDVGAMTLDACMFGYIGGDYKPYTAMVRPLGVESFHWFVNEGKTKLGFTEQCERCLWWVVWSAKRDHVPQIPCWKPGNDLPVFLVGGGAQHILHRQIVDGLSPWLVEYTGNNGIRLLSLPIPQGIDLPEALTEFGRLAVAWGLSYSPDQIGDFPPSSSIEKTPPLPRRREAAFVSKDHV